MAVTTDSPSLTNEQSLIDQFCVSFNADKSIWMNGKISQESLSLVIDNYKLKHYQSQLPSLQSKARFLCNTAPNSGSWITAIPTSSKLRLSPDEYRIACYLRYGWKMFDEHNYDKHCIDCGKDVDDLGIHCLHCGQFGGWTMRHNAIRDCLFQWPQKAQLSVEKEKNGLLEDGKKPADIYIHSYLDRTDYALDVTVTSPYKFDIIRDAAHETLAAASQASINKYKKYEKDVINKSWQFQPLCFEASGGFDKPSRLLINAIATAVASRYGIAKAVIIRSITNELSVILTRAASRMVLRRMVEKEPLNY